MVHPSADHAYAKCALLEIQDKPRSLYLSSGIKKISNSAAPGMSLINLFFFFCCVFLFVSLFSLASIYVFKGGRCYSLQQKKP